MTTLYAHRIDANNPGDLWSTPWHYINKQVPGMLADILNLPVSATEEKIYFDNVIIGGGAVMHSNKMIDNLLKLLSRIEYKNLVIWGAGVDTGNYPEELIKQATLVGVREHAPDTWAEDYWVPCASVMHGELPKAMKIKKQKDFLVIDHWKRSPIEVDADHTRISNSPCTIDQMLTAIAEHNYIITSSFHAVYWATLLKKRVVFCSDPYIPKCEQMRHPPVSAQHFSWELLDRSRAYKNAYEECLDANQRFFDRVLEITNP